MLNREQVKYETSDSSDDLSDDDYAELADAFDSITNPGHSGNVLKERIVKFQDRMDLSDCNRRIRTKDKSDRATIDRALDDRSIKILYKMMSQGVFTDINGVISSGKESNVYYAQANNSEMAVKVFMTSILQFRNRDTYVAGDWRLRAGYSKGSSWKKVKVWAEKEYRNLLRIRLCGRIPCPEPIKIKGVVLVMSLIGKNGEAAPRLKDAPISTVEEWVYLYEKVVMQLRVLFQECSLIHADFSEYNLLYHEGEIYMIDVSQSVEHNHPKALEFLRTDCYNCNLFFQRQGVCTLTLREMFDFIVDPVIKKENGEELVCLKEALRRAACRPDSFDNSSEDMAFKKMFLPRNLDAVINFRRDQYLVQKGLIHESDILYASIIGMKNDLSGPKTISELLPQKDLHVPSQGPEDIAASSLSEMESTERGKFVSSRRPKNESPSSKKDRKQTVKMENREKRKLKVKKYDKKKSVKSSKK